MIQRLAQHKLSARTQVILFGGGCVCLLLAFIFGVYRPSMAELKALHTQNDVSRGAIGALEEAQRQHAEVVKAHAQAVANATQALSQFPRDSDLPSIMAAVDRLAREHGAKTEVIDYASPKWEKGSGKVQVTALFTGDYPALASLVVDLPRLLPSAYLEQVRFTARAKEDAPVVVQSDSSPEAATPVAVLLRKALGLTAFFAEPVVEQQQTNISPLEIDHIEAQLIFTVYLVGAETGQAETKAEQAAAENRLAELEKLLGGKGHWHPQVINHWRGVSSNPFRPSERAADLVQKLQLVERYQDVKVTGIGHADNQWVALVEFMSQTHRVKAGDKLGDAVVSRIDSQGITLVIAGRSIFISLGGEQG